MKIIRRSKRGFTLVELMVVITIIGILAAVGTPAMMIALDRARKSSDTQNIRQLGIALMASASASDDQRYPFQDKDGNVAATSTEAFKALLLNKEIPTADLVFSPGATKIKFTGTTFTSLSDSNVGYSYTQSSIGTAPAVPGGVSMSADDNIPLLMSAGNLISGDYISNYELTLSDNAIWKKTGCTVYYKGNNATFKKGSATGTIKSFIVPTFTPVSGVTFSLKQP